MISWEANKIETLQIGDTPAPRLPRKKWTAASRNWSDGRSSHKRTSPGTYNFEFNWDYVYHLFMPKIIRNAHHAEVLLPPQTRYIAYGFNYNIIYTVFLYVVFKIICNASRLCFLFSQIPVKHAAKRIRIEPRTTTGNCCQLRKHRRLTIFTRQKPQAPIHRIF